MKIHNKILKMDWIKFKKKFGENTTSNLELIRIAKYLKVKPFRCVMRDEIKDLPQYGYFIINIHTSNQPGVHWSAVYSDPKTVYNFDSYALPPLKEIITKFNHTSNRFCEDYHEQIQTFDKKYCGQMSMFFLYKLSLTKNKTVHDYKSILKDIKNE